MDMTASTGANPSWTYRAGVAAALATGLAVLWTTIVRDDGNGLGFLMLVLAAAVGAFAVRGRAEGLARAMLGVAVIQAFVGLMIATAPSTEQPLRVLLFNGVFAALWLVSAGCFWKAAR
jgi:hypothetical protein